MKAQEFFDLIDLIENNMKINYEKRMKIDSGSLEDIVCLGRDSGLIQAKGILIDYFKSHKEV